MSNGKLATELRNMLKSGEKITAQARDEFMLGMLADIYELLDKLAGEQTNQEKRVKKLEDTSIVLFAMRHPKVAIMMFIILMTLLNVWFVSDFRHVFLAWLGLPPDLLP